MKTNSLEIIRNNTVDHSAREKTTTSAKTLAARRVLLTVKKIHLHNLEHKPPLPRDESSGTDVQKTERDKLSLKRIDDSTGSGTNYRAILQ